MKARRPISDGSMLDLNSAVPKDYELTDYCCKVTLLQKK